MKQANKAKILLVEDDKFISRAYFDGLQRAGYEVKQAFDGAVALELARSEKPDLILLDLILPIKDGFDVLTEIKSDKSLSYVPVVILSNLGQDSDVVKGKELGAVDYLIKTSHSLQQVTDKVKYYLAKTKK